jgi:hypothetical protein
MSQFGPDGWHHQRGILRACATILLSTISVGDVMTVDVAVGLPADSVEDRWG